MNNARRQNVLVKLALSMEDIGNKMEEARAYVGNRMGGLETSMSRLFGDNIAKGDYSNYLGDLAQVIGRGQDGAAALMAEGMGNNDRVRGILGQLENAGGRARMGADEAAMTMGGLVPGLSEKRPSRPMSRAQMERRVYNLGRELSGAPEGGISPSQMMNAVSSARSSAEWQKNIKRLNDTGGSQSPSGLMSVLGGAGRLSSNGGGGGSAGTPAGLMAVLGGAGRAMGAHERGGGQSPSGLMSVLGGAGRLVGGGSDAEPPRRAPTNDRLGGMSALGR